MIDDMPKWRQEKRRAHLEDFYASRSDAEADRLVAWWMLRGGGADAFENIGVHIPTDEGTNAPGPMIPIAEDAPTIDVVTAGRALGIGATRSYGLAQTGQLTEGVPVIRVGAKYRVPTACLRRVLGLDEGQ